MVILNITTLHNAYKLITKRKLKITKNYYVENVLSFGESENKIHHTTCVHTNSKDDENKEN